MRRLHGNTLNRFCSKVRERSCRIDIKPQTHTYQRINFTNMKYLTTFISLCLPLCLKADKQPNIVFFFTDDQTSSSLGCYGHPLAQTPNLDRLAAEGTRFSNACVSQSICWVSRTTILTGLTGRSFGSPSQPDQATPESVRELYRHSP